MHRSRHTQTHHIYAIRCKTTVHCAACELWKKIPLHNHRYQKNASIYFNFIAYTEDWSFFLIFLECLLRLIKYFKSSCVYSHTHRERHIQYLLLYFTYQPFNIKYVKFFSLKNSRCALFEMKKKNMRIWIPVSNMYSGEKMLYLKL